MLTSEFLLFAPSSAYAKAPAGLYRINPDGTDKHTVHGNEVWSMFRSDYESIVYTTGRDWFTFNMNDKSTEQLEGQPTEYNSRVYVDSPDGTKSVWVDQVDGKGVIMLNRLDDSEESIVVTQGGLQLPVSWLNNDTIVFRVKTELETADYVANINGGEPKKLADVTNAAGIDRWYYY
jgi:hypothetical protein